MQLSNFVVAENILCGSAASDMNEAKEQLLQLYRKNTSFDADPVRQALVEREKLGSTVIAPGIAMPHIRETFLDDFYVFIGLFPDGVHAEEGEVKLCTMYLVPEGKSNLYLRIMSAMCRLLAVPGALDCLVACKSGQDVCRYIAEHDIQIGEVVTAGDIMQSAFPHLDADATLRQAADLMVQNNISDIPVIDEDENFLGLVTTGRLLKVGIPEYLLMMDNLSFLKTFEPFQDLLKQEQTMKVSEVMKTKVPTFAKNTPMIQVAAKLVDEHVEFGVVLDGKKLIGTISRLDFIHKVVRV